MASGKCAVTACPRPWVATRDITIDLEWAPDPHRKATYPAKVETYIRLCEEHDRRRR